MAIEVGVDIERTATGTVRRVRVETPTPRVRAAALALPGARDSSSRKWVSFPAEPLLLRELQQHLASVADALVLTEAADLWFNVRQFKARASIAVANQPDAACDAPYAERLYPYQRVGAEWLRAVERGILGDDPGLGKTIQALTAVRDAQTVLIVTLNSVKSHWERHVREWLGRDVAVLTGDHRTRQRDLDCMPSWAIVNHEMLRPSGTGAYRHLTTRTWDAVIIDEAHKLQGRASQQSRGAKLLRSQRLLLLTGTPIWNKPDSIWHLLHLLDPDRFSSYWTFVNTYMETYATPWATEIIGLKPSAIDTLHDVLHPLVLQRRKERVLPQLPPKIVETVEYDLTSQQRRAYRSIKSRLRLDAPDGTPVKLYASSASALADLRGVCNAPSLLGINGDNPKDRVIDDLLDSLLGDGRKVVLFTWHVAYAQYLAQRLKSWGTVLLTGDTPDRDAVLDNYRKGETPILVATIATVGIGIDLTEATAAIFAEGSYVPVLNAQAEDRLHRIGTRSSPLIYRLAARNSVESAIWDIANERTDLANEMLAVGEVARRVAAQGD